MECPGGNRGVCDGEGPGPNPALGDLHQAASAGQFPQWNRMHLVELACTILRKIDKLHQYNVLIGDINPDNILLVDEKTVYFVDTDSYQVGAYPCPVGTDTFTPAARQGMDYSTFLRTKEDELFAVATLLFVILFPGKAPYSAMGAVRLPRISAIETFLIAKSRKERSARSL